MKVGDQVVGITIGIQPYKVMGNRREQGFIELWPKADRFRRQFFHHKHYASGIPLGLS